MDILTKQKEGMILYVKWITMKVKNMDEAKKFYKDFLGLEELRAFSPCPGKQIVFLGMDTEVQIELICDETEENHFREQSVSIGIAVKDFDGIYQKAAEYGLSHSEPQIMGKNMECFFLTSPDGVKLQMIRETQH